MAGGRAHPARARRADERCWRGEKRHARWDGVPSPRATSPSGTRRRRAAERREIGAVSRALALESRPGWRPASGRSRRMISCGIAAICRSRSCRRATELAPEEDTQAGQGIARLDAQRRQAASGRRSATPRSSSLASFPVRPRSGGRNSQVRSTCRMAQGAQRLLGARGLIPRWACGGAHQPQACLAAGLPTGREDAPRRRDGSRDRGLCGMGEGQALLAMTLLRRLGF